MTRTFLMLLSYLMLGLCLLGFVSCGKDKTSGGSTEETQGIAINDKTVAGVSQKGPFVKGASVHLYGLDWGTFAQSGSIFTGKINSDHGDFKVTGVNLRSQYALLEANGYYRNEVTGEKSNSPITLFALTDLSDRENVNINLLTHLEYERVLQLIDDGISVKNAKKQAEQEILESFYINLESDNFEDLNIFNSGEGDAALLAISILLQGDRAEADLSELFTEYALDMEQDGVWDNEKLRTELADWAEERTLTCTETYGACFPGGNLAGIRNNIEKWEMSDVVPAFEPYVQMFWWMNYGLGICDAKRQDELKDAYNEFSANNGRSYVCDNNMWRRATGFEADTYKWTAGKDGDVKKGNKSESNCYVFEDDVWNLRESHNCDLGIRGCTKSIKNDMLKAMDNSWYVCDGETWKGASALEVKGCSAAEQDSVAAEDGLFLVCYNKKWIRTTEEHYMYGACYDKYELKLIRNNEGFFSMCRDGIWVPVDDASEIEGSCNALNDSLIIFDRWSSKYHRCVKGKWTDISPEDYDEWLSLSRFIEINGLCTIKRENEVAKIGDWNVSYRVCKSGEWVETNQFIYENGECTAERENEVTDVPDFAICKSGEWVEIDKDEYYWLDRLKQFKKENGACTAERENEVTDVPDFAICKSGEWTAMDEKDLTFNQRASLENGVCTSARENEWVEKPNYAICKSGEWVEINEYEYYRLARQEQFEKENGECTAERENETVELQMWDGYHYAICKSGEWVEANQFIYENGECTAERENEVTDVPDFAICKSGEWVEITRDVYNRGVCTAERENEVVKTPTPDAYSYYSYYICKSGEWTAMDEKDLTFNQRASLEYGVCTAERENEWVEKPDFAICKSGEWTAVEEKDLTFNQRASLKHGVCTSARENEMVDKPGYAICKSGEWVEINEDEYYRLARQEQFEKENGECTAERENEMVDKPDYAICKSGEWVETDQFIYENGVCTSERENETVKTSNWYSDTYHICKSGEWTAVNEWDLTLEQYASTDENKCTFERENEVAAFSYNECTIRGYAICKSGVWTEISGSEYSKLMNEKCELLVKQKLLKENGTCTSERENESVYFWLNEKINGYWDCSDAYFYICSDDSWKETNHCTYELGLCTSELENVTKYIKSLLTPSESSVRCTCSGGMWTNQ